MSPTPAVPSPPRLTKWKRATKKALEKHHLIEGNIPIGTDCDVCKQSFEFFGVNGVRCSRCEKKVHTKCISALCDKPCLPRHKNLLYRKKFRNQELLSTDPGIDSPDISRSIAHHPPVHSHDGEENLTPVIAFVNPKSGGQAGPKLLKNLIRLLEGHQVFNIVEDQGPYKGLKAFKGVKNLRVIVCGGDGTVGWVMSAIDQLQFDPFPPVGIIPLGTGNDLAQSLGWGTGYNGEDLSPILDAVEDALIVNLDRWNVAIAEVDKDVERKVMNNYMSIGVDAGIALEFHNLRESSPGLFTSQTINKFWYAHYGLMSMFGDSNELADLLDIEVDDKKLTLPMGLGGIMILNLQSYSGGVNLWGIDPTGLYKTPGIDDGLLEVVGISGGFHMGTIQVKLSEAIRLGQGFNLKIKMKKILPIQVDGEPWSQNPCDMQVSFRNQARMLFKNEEHTMSNFRSTITNNKDEFADVDRERRFLKSENETLKKEVRRLRRELRSYGEERTQLLKRLEHLEKMTGITTHSASETSKEFSGVLGSRNVMPATSDGSDVSDEALEKEIEAAMEEVNLD
eukprot:TRINITY_DN1891_c0_g1_i3.p1 TRINITY_DN1891_c0_g1~~TRINITY_DN1891_c0_g1_i3.p1  ORF type:complete len:565 (-),score=169.01 TRINITY_DN1891_c0_g1_i3:35-1729(-)